MDSGKLRQTSEAGLLEREERNNECVQEQIVGEVASQQRGRKVAGVTSWAT